MLDPEIGFMFKASRLAAPKLSHQGDYFLTV
jgi:hypothetical protein